MYDCHARIWVASRVRGEGGANGRDFAVAKRHISVVDKFYATAEKLCVSLIGRRTVTPPGGTCVLIVTQVSANWV